MITWIVLRAAGIGAYLMLFGSVAWGLVATTSVFGKKVSKATAISVHQFISTVALLLLGAHLGGLLLDTFVKFRPLDLLVPMHSAFKPVAVAFGIVALYGMVVVLASSWMRKQVGPRWWRRLHMFAVPTWILAMVHGVFAGTDAVRPVMWWTYVATGGIVLFLVILRALTADLRPERHAVPTGARTAGPTPHAARPAAAPKTSPAPEAADPVTVPIPVTVAQADSPTVVLRVEVSFAAGGEPTARVLGSDAAGEPAPSATPAGGEEPGDDETDHVVLPFER